MIPDGPEIPRWLVSKGTWIFCIHVFARQCHWGSRYEQMSDFSLLGNPTPDMDWYDYLHWKTVMFSWTGAEDTPWNISTFDCHCDYPSIFD